MSHNIGYSNAKASENLTTLCNTGVAQYRLYKRPEVLEDFALIICHKLIMYFDEVKRSIARIYHDNVFADCP